MNEVLIKLEGMEKKLQTLQAKEDIRDILSRYAFNVDLNRIDNFLKLFADDMLFITDGPGEQIIIKEKQGLKDFLARILPETHPGQQHLQLDYVVTVNGNTASATGYQLLTKYSDGKFSIARCAIRTFDFRRVDGDWKITRAVSHSTANAQDCQKQVPQSW